jgi:hypothetical protein
MRRWFRLLPLLITALWLPLQAVAAVAMPFCRHAAEQAAAADATTHEEHCPGHAMESPTVDVPAAIDCDQDCDGCELCHLASAGYMPAAVVTAAHPSVSRDFQLRTVLASPSFVPEPPQHPPRHLS